jgi:hypothetical protein
MWNSAASFGRRTGTAAASRLEWPPWTNSHIIRYVMKTCTSTRQPPRSGHADEVRLDLLFAGCIDVRVCGKREKETLKLTNESERTTRPCAYLVG